MHETYINTFIKNKHYQMKHVYLFFATKIFLQFFNCLRKILVMGNHKSKFIYLLGTHQHFKNVKLLLNFTE